MQKSLVVERYIYINTRARGFYVFFNTQYQTWTIQIRIVTPLTRKVTKVLSYNTKRMSTVQNQKERPILDKKIRILEHRVLFIFSIQISKYSPKIDQKDILSPIYQRFSSRIGINILSI